MVDANQTLAEAWTTRQADLDNSSANGKLVVFHNDRRHVNETRFWNVDIIKNYSAIIYKTTGRDIGEEAAKVTPQRPVQHGFNGKFSQVSRHLVKTLTFDFVLASAKIRHAS